MTFKQKMYDSYVELKFKYVYVTYITEKYITTIYVRNDKKDC